MEWTSAWIERWEGRQPSAHFYTTLCIRAADVTRRPLIERAPSGERRLEFADNTRKVHWPSKPTWPPDSGDGGGCGVFPAPQLNTWPAASATFALAGGTGKSN